MGHSRHCLLLLLLPMAVCAAQEHVIQAENVRLDYAQVLNVEPVYQTLRASRTEQVCDTVPAQPKHNAAPVRPEQSRWSRIVESVKGIFSSSDPSEALEADAQPKRSAEPTRTQCKTVPVEREFRRPIAYDVDYVYRGTRYRSRLAEDPGNRLRIRISVMPYVPNVAPVEADTP